MDMWPVTQVDFKTFATEKENAEHISVLESKRSLIVIGSDHLLVIQNCGSI